MGMEDSSGRGSILFVPNGSWARGAAVTETSTPAWRALMKKAGRGSHGRPSAGRKQGTTVRSIVRRLAADRTSRGRSRLVAKEPRMIGAQAAATGPGPQSLDRFGRRGGDRHDILSRLDQRHVQQRRQSAAGLDFRARPLGVVGPPLLGIQSIARRCHSPDGVLLLAAGEVEKEDPVEPLRPAEFRRQPGNVICRADHEHIRLMVVEPREQRAEQPGRDTRIIASARSAEGLLHLVNQQDGGAIASTVRSACRVRSSV